MHANIYIFSYNISSHNRNIFVQVSRNYNLVVATLALGLATKARACKGAGQELSPGVTFHALEDAKECEGMNPHTPK